MPCVSFVRLLSHATLYPGLLCTVNFLFLDGVHLTSSLGRLGIHTSVRALQQWVPARWCMPESELSFVLIIHNRWCTTKTHGFSFCQLQVQGQVTSLVLCLESFNVIVCFILCSLSLGISSLYGHDSDSSKCSSHSRWNIYQLDWPLPCDALGKITNCPRKKSLTTGLQHARLSRCCRWRFTVQARSQWSHGH